MDLEIRPLAPELAEDYLTYFDSTAFSDNADWAGCYCCFYHFADNDTWEKRSGQQNRDFAEGAVICGAMSGYIAYREGTPVGWVSAGRRENYARLSANNDLPKGENILSIVCFNVSPSFRREGIARALLQAVTEGAKGVYDYVEAYPIKNSYTDALCYHGPLHMYEKAGFEIVKELEGYWVLRKNLFRK